jgi:hypothetical protein
MTELKRCPFCGIEVDRPDEDFHPIHHCPVVDMSFFLHWENSWNTRPIEDELGVMWQEEHTEKIRLDERLKMANARVKELEERVRASGYDPERLWE